MPGFRPGKIPRKVLEARLGPTAGRQDALEHSLPTYYGRALIDNEVDAIGPPEIEITSDITHGAVTFEATVPIRPKPSITGHSALEIEIPSPIVTEEEFQAQVSDAYQRDNAAAHQVGEDLSADKVYSIQDTEQEPGYKTIIYKY